MEGWTFTLKRRRQVMEKSKGFCWYCGQRIALLTGRAWAVDHVVSRHFGGLTTLGNSVAACHQCNIQKFKYSIEVFRERLRVKHNLDCYYFWGEIFQPSHVAVALEIGEFLDACKRSRLSNPEIFDAYHAYILSEERLWDIHLATRGNKTGLAKRRPFKRKRDKARKAYYTILKQTLIEKFGTTACF